MLLFPRQHNIRTLRVSLCVSRQIPSQDVVYWKLKVTKNTYEMRSENNMCKRN